MTIIQDRLAELDGLTLDHGSHNTFDEGHCAMEVVSWLAGEGFTDAPACASPVLQRYMITLNDRWDTEQRQTLKPYLVRMIGTGGDGKDELREQVAAKFLAERLLEPWLRLAGMDEQADQLGTLVGADRATRRATLRAISAAAWKLRDQRYQRWSTLRAQIEVKVREHLAAQGKPVDVAAAVAAAADVAAAVAAAADVAAAAAAAVDVAVAAADAAAVAVAAAAAVDVAVAAADAAAAAVAADVAAAAADLTPGSKGYWDVRNAAYAAARKYYDEHPLPVIDQIKDLAASQQGLALELLDKLIDPQAA